MQPSPANLHWHAVHVSGLDDSAVRAVLRASESDEPLNAVIDQAIKRKPRGHDFRVGPDAAAAVSKHMSVTGGQAGALPVRDRQIDVPKCSCAGSSVPRLPFRERFGFLPSASVFSERFGFLLGQLVKRANFVRFQSNPAEQEQKPVRVPVPEEMICFR